MNLQRHPSVPTVWALALSAAIVVSCNAHVGKFEVEPRHICPGDEVSIIWEVTGNASLTTTPPVAAGPNGAVASTGSLRIKPTADTHVSLRVTRFTGEPTGADADVHVPAPVELAAELDNQMSCTDDVLRLITETKAFAPGVTAGPVGGSKRALDITHEDGAGKAVTAHVDAGAFTDAFSNTPAGGKWTLATHLQSPESCSQPPHVLTVNIGTRCQGATR